MGFMSYLLGHILAASMATKKGCPLASLGFLTVALAGFIGGTCALLWHAFQPPIFQYVVLRFGLNEDAFASTNGSLADFAAFVGLPCVGLTFLKRVGVVQLNATDTTMVIILGTAEAATRGLHPSKREMAKILVNVFFFVFPVALVSAQEGNLRSLGGIGLFVVAGLVITADRHRSIAGIRCENWFHYCIGAAAYLVAHGI